MSTLVLLNMRGVVERKLQFVTLPSDFVVPEGMTLSWRIDISRSSGNLAAVLGIPPEPLEAYFYLGNAVAQVCRNNFEESVLLSNNRRRYGYRDLQITVQGTSSKDVMGLRDHILNLIHSNVRWGVHNNLNPKPTLLEKLKKKFQAH